MSENQGIITTFPIGVRSDKPKLGLFMIPILSDFIRRRNEKLELRIILNTLDSYRERDCYITPYVDQLERFGISRNEVLVDKDYKSSLKKTVSALYEEGYLKEEIRDRYMCHCGKLEMLTGGSLNPSARFYSVREGIPHCNLCDTDAEIIKGDPILVMKYPEWVSPGSVVPAHQGKEARRLYEDIPGHEFLVSRTRDTGVGFEGELANYSLDVDFVWMNFLSLFDKGKPIFAVGSNHVLWHLCLMNALLQCSGERRDERKSTIIAPSYLVEGTDSPQKFIEKGYSLEDPNLARTLVLSSLSFNLKNSHWNPGILKYAKKRLNLLSGGFPEEERAQDEEVLESIKYLKRTNIEMALREGKVLGEGYDIRGWLV